MNESAGPIKQGSPDVTEVKSGVQLNQTPDSAALYPGYELYEHPLSQILNRQHSLITQCFQQPKLRVGNGNRFAHGAVDIN